VKPLDHIIDIILAILVFFLFPILYFSLKQDTLIQTVTNTGTKSLVGEIRSDGYLTKERYEEYLGSLSKTGLTYDISLEHWLTIEEPEYRFRTPEEIIDLQNALYTGSNIYHYRPVSTEVPPVTDPVYTGNLNTETNESVLASATNTSASSTHIHTDACYGGPRNTEPPRFTHYHAHTGSCRQGYAAVMPSGTCNSCNQVIQYGYMWYYFDQYYNQVFASAHWETNCPKCGAGLSTRNNYTQYDVMYSCGYSKDLNGDGWNDVVAIGVTEAYPNRQMPQGYTTGTIINGDWSYHSHAFTGSGNETTSSSGHIYAYIVTNDSARAFAEGRTYRDSYGNLLDQPYYFQNIFYWAKELTNNYSGVTCSSPGYMSVGKDFTINSRVWNGNRWIAVPKWNEKFCTVFTPKVVNGKIVFDLKLQINEITNTYTTGYNYTTTSKNYTAETSKGEFSKSFFTVEDISYMYDNDMMAYLYDNLTDKNSGFAKALFKCRAPKTGNAWYEGYDSSWEVSIYEEGQPIIDYAYPTSGYTMGTGYCYGYLNHCIYTDGPLYRWNIDPDKVNVIICNQLVNSIAPTHPTQTVYRNDPLITTVIITYADGSTKTVAAATDFNTANLYQSQIATLNYSYSVDGTSYTKICTVNVTVVPRNKTCVNGHVYNLNADGSDPGCPYCKAWLSSLTLVIPSDGKLTIYRGTNLDANGVELNALYLDGYLETVTGGYEDNLDKDYIGTQTVTIGYKGKTVSLTVTVKRNLTRCTVCGRYYELYADDSDPGCPYCAAKTPVFTGNVLEYKKEKYTDDILKELYEGDGIYYFSREDYLKISLTNSTRSPGGRMNSLLYKSLSEENIRTEDGGFIREDGQ
jgi:Zn finger protein HypA/HybF involved in hydrogenase expression